MHDLIELTQDLISRPSVTPADLGCQTRISECLAPHGFRPEPLRFGEVDNLWLRRGTAAPLFVFAGHTDVVPSGPAERWLHDPFKPVIRDGYLYGRGAADMKGSIAAMVVACERFVSSHPQHPGSIALLLTSDEEGPSVDGTRRVMETLNARHERIEWCVVGEPSSQEKVGDTVKIGRRGSITGNLRIKGVQGHVAYPHLADNPIHRAAALLDELASTVWDKGNAHFPPTTFQVSNIHSGTGAENVIPGELETVFNFRYSTEQTADRLKSRVIELLDRHGLQYDIRWRHSGEPFLTRTDGLVQACRSAIREVTGLDCQLSTSGGTSDGRFIAPSGAQVIELGPLNATIHKVDECVRVDDLHALAAMYERILCHLLLPASQKS